MPRPRHAAALAALGLAAGCTAAGFVDVRTLPWQPLVSREFAGEERIAVDGVFFDLRRYTEVRGGLGTVSAHYVVADGRPRQVGDAAGGAVYSGLVRDRLFFSNFPGEWFCGTSRAACIDALEPVEIFLRERD